MRSAVKLVFLVLFATSCVSMMSADVLNIQNGTFANCSGSCTGWTFTPAAAGSDFFFDGNGNAAFGGTAPGYYDQISQVVSTTSGTSYTLGFDLSNDGAGPGLADFQVTWDNNVVLDVGPSAFGTTPFSVTGLTGTGSDTLGFQAYQVPAYYYLSNVGAATVPEPSMLAMLIPALGFAGLLRRKLAK